MRKKIVQIRTTDKIELKLMAEINEFLKKRRGSKNERKNRVYT